MAIVELTQLSAVCQSRASHVRDIRDPGPPSGRSGGRHFTISSATIGSALAANVVILSPVMTRGPLRHDQDRSAASRDGNPTQLLATKKILEAQLNAQHTRMRYRNS